MSNHLPEDQPEIIIKSTSDLYESFRQDVGLLESLDKKEQMLAEIVARRINKATIFNARYDSADMLTIAKELYPEETIDIEKIKKSIAVIAKRATQKLSEDTFEKYKNICENKYRHVTNLRVLGLWYRDVFNMPVES